MRIFTIVGSILGLGNLVAGIPALQGSSTEDKCGVTTVYLTAPVSVSTVVYTVAASTEAPGIYASGLPETGGSNSRHASIVAHTFHKTHTHTIYKTHFVTRTVTSAEATDVETVEAYSAFASVIKTKVATNSVAATLSSGPLRHPDNTVVTVYSTAVITVTSFYLTLAPSGGYVTYTDTVAPNGQLPYTIVDDTTYWLGSQTPASSKITVLKTVAMTPLVTASSASNDGGISTVVIQSTISEGKIYSATRPSVIDTSTDAALAASSTGISFPGHGYGGWNISVSSIVGSLTMSGFNVIPSADAFLATATGSINLYYSRAPTVPASSLVAQSGFLPSPTLEAAATTSSTRSLNTLVSATVRGPPFPTISDPPVWTSYSTNISFVSTNSASPTSYAPSSSSESATTSLSRLNSTSSAILASSSSESTTTSLSGLNSTSSAILASSTISVSSSESITILSEVSSTTSASSLEIAVSSTSEIVSAMPSSAVSSSAPSISSLSGPVVLGSASSELTSSSSTLVTSSVSSTASAIPTACGEHGDFTLNFDDLPPLSVSNNATAQPMPLFSPYHQFYFVGGFTVVPPPTDPYLPSSPPLLLEFLYDPDISTPATSTGEVSNDRTALLGCFNFNALGASVGCDSKGPDCDWQFTGLRYNFTSKKEDLVVTQIVTTSSCPELSNCNLVPIVLDSTFQNLTTLKVNVTVAGAPKIWWMDDLKLGWYDNSCSAGLCRQENI